MDCRAASLWGLAVLVLMVAMAEGRSKKVVIHVPFKLKKIKHTHTVYKTIHHHHGMRDHHDHHDLGSTMIHETHHLPPTAEDHEHFHHMHLRDEQQAGQHTQPIPGIGIPEFLPDVPMDPDDMAHDMSVGRRVPMFRRAGPDDE